MPSTRFAVVEAVRALVGAALPAADMIGLDGDDGKARRLGPDGMIGVGDGDPGAPEIDLSPPTWWWEHAIPVQLAAYGDDAPSARRALDAMLGAIGTAIVADRTLGGLCIHLEADAPQIGDATKEGARTVHWADVDLVATYSTSSPLG